MAITDADLLAAFRRLEKPLYNVLYRLLWNAHDCEDLIQEAFLRVWDRRRSTEAERLDPLIYTAALNLAKNKLRWRSLWRFGQASVEAPIDLGGDPAEVAEQAQREATLRGVLAGFDADTRNLVLLSECAGLTTEELTTVFGWPAGTIASRKHRALARLRTELGALGFTALDATKGMLKPQTLETPQ